MTFSRWRAETRRLISLAREPAIAGAICGLILSWNSTDLLIAWAYAALGFSNILAYLTTTWFPASEPAPLSWVRDRLMRVIGIAVRRFWGS